jgi:hypothetical protein
MPSVFVVKLQARDGFNVTGQLLRSASSYGFLSASGPLTKGNTTTKP